MTTQRILPPMELSPRVVPRDPAGKHSASQADSVRGAVHSAVIRWRDLVLAVWELGDGEEYTGELPAGLSSQQFWAKVMRAARAIGGEVGVATRGPRWWAWTVKRGRSQAKDARHAALLGHLESAGVVRLGYEPLASERTSIRNAAMRRGMRVRFERGADEMVIVRNMGAVKRRTRRATQG